MARTLKLKDLNGNPWMKIKGKYGMKNLHQSSGDASEDTAETKCQGMAKLKELNTRTPTRARQQYAHLASVLFLDACGRDSTTQPPVDAYKTICDGLTFPEVDAERAEALRKECEQTVVEYHDASGEKLTARGVLNQKVGKDKTKKGITGVGLLGIAGAVLVILLLIFFLTKANKRAASNFMQQ